MPDEIVLTDYEGDKLTVGVSFDRLWIESEDEETTSFGFNRDTDGVREVRDLLTTWLDDQPSASVTRASEIEFNEALLRLAAVHGKTVVFRYAKGDGHHIELRRLIPNQILKVQKDGIEHLTFVGHDPDRDDVRAYRYDRIKGEVSVA